MRIFQSSQVRLRRTGLSLTISRRDVAGPCTVCICRLSCGRPSLWSELILIGRRIKGLVGLIGLGMKDRQRTSAKWPTISRYNNYGYFVSHVKLTRCKTIREYLLRLYPGGCQQFNRKRRHRAQCKLGPDQGYSVNHVLKFEFK